MVDVSVQIKLFDQPKMMAVSSDRRKVSSSVCFDIMRKRSGLWDDGNFVLSVVEHEMLNNVTDAIGDDKAAVLLMRMHKTFRITCVHENVNSLLEAVTSQFQESLSPDLPWHPSIIETIVNISRQGFVSCFINWRKHLIRKMNTLESLGFTFDQLDRALPLFVFASRQDFKSPKMISAISNTRRRVSLIDGKIRSLIRSKSSSDMLICDSPNHGDSATIAYECFIKAKKDDEDGDEGEGDANVEPKRKLNMISLLKESGVNSTNVTSDDSVSRWMREFLYDQPLHPESMNFKSVMYDSYKKTTDSPESVVKFNQTIKAQLFVLLGREIERMKQTTTTRLFKGYQRDLKLDYVSDFAVQSLIDGIVAKRKRADHVDLVDDCMNPNDLLTWSPFDGEPLKMRTQLFDDADDYSGSFDIPIMTMFPGFPVQPLAPSDDGEISADDLHDRLNIMDESDERHFFNWLTGNKHFDTIESFRFGVFHPQSFESTESIKRLSRKLASLPAKKGMFNLNVADRKMDFFDMTRKIKRSSLSREQVGFACEMLARRVSCMLNVLFDPALSDHFLLIEFLRAESEIKHKDIVFVKNRFFKMKDLLVYVGDVKFHVFDANDVETVSFGIIENVRHLFAKRFDFKNNKVKYDINEEVVIEKLMRFNILACNATIDQRSHYFEASLARDGNAKIRNHVSLLFSNETMTTEDVRLINLAKDCIGQMFEFYSNFDDEMFCFKPNDGSINFSIIHHFRPRPQILFMAFCILERFNDVVDIRTCHVQQKTFQVFSNRFIYSGNVLDLLLKKKCSRIDRDQLNSSNFYEFIPLSEQPLNRIIFSRDEIIKCFDIDCFSFSKFSQFFRNTKTSLEKTSKKLKLSHHFVSIDVSSPLTLKTLFVHDFGVKSNVIETNIVEYLKTRFNPLSALITTRIEGNSLVSDALIERCSLEQEAVVSAHKLKQLEVLIDQTLISFVEDDSFASLIKLNPNWFFECCKFFSLLSPSCSSQLFNIIDVLWCGVNSVKDLVLNEENQSFCISVIFSMIRKTDMSFNVIDGFMFEDLKTSNEGFNDMLNDFLKNVFNSISSNNEPVHLPTEMIDNENLKELKKRMWSDAPFKVDDVKERIANKEISKIIELIEKEAESNQTIFENDVSDLRVEKAKLDPLVDALKSNIRTSTALVETFGDQPSFSEMADSLAIFNATIRRQLQELDISMKKNKTLMESTSMSDFEKMRLVNENNDMIKKMMDSLTHELISQRSKSISQDQTMFSIKKSFMVLNERIDDVLQSSAVRQNDQRNKIEREPSSLDDKIYDSIDDIRMTSDRIYYLSNQSNKIQKMIDQKNDDLNASSNPIELGKCKAKLKSLTLEKNSADIEFKQKLSERNEQIVLLQRQLRALNNDSRQKTRDGIAKARKDFKSSISKQIEGKHIELDALSAKKIELDNQIASLNSSAEALSSQIKEMNKISNDTQLNQAKIREREDMLSEMGAMKIEQARLQAVNEELTENIALSKKEFDESNMKRKNVEELLREKEHQLSSRNVESSELKKLVSDCRLSLSVQKGKTKAITSSVAAQIQHLKTFNKVLNESLDYLNADSNRKSELLRMERKSIVQKQLEIDTLKNEMISLKRDAQAKDDSFRQLTLSIEKTSETIDALNDSVFKMDSEIRALRSQIDDSNETSVEFRKRIIDISGKEKEIQKLKETILEKQNEIRFLMSRFEKLQSQMIDFQNNLSQLSQTGKENAQLAKVIHDKDSEISSLMSQVQGLTSSSIELNSAISMRNDQISKLTEEMNLREKDLGIQRKEVNDLLEQIAEFENMTHEHVSEIEELRNQIQRLESEKYLNSDLLNLISEKVSNIEDLKRKIDRLESDKALLNSKISNLKSEKASDIEGLSRMVERLKSENDLQQSDLVLMQSEMTRLNLVISDKERERAEFLQLFKELEVNQENDRITQNRISEMEKENKILSNSISEKESEIKGLEERVAFLVARHTALKLKGQSDNKKLIAELNAKENERARFAESVVEKENEMIHLRRKLNSLERDSDMKNEKEMLMRSVSEKESRIARLTEETEARKRQFDLSNQTNRDLKKKIEDLNVQLMALLVEKRTLENELRDSKAQKEVLYLQIQVLESQILAMKTERQTIADELDRNMSKFSGLEKEVYQSTHEIQELKRQVQELTNKQSLRFEKVSLGTELEMVKLVQRLNDSLELNRLNEIKISESLQQNMNDSKEIEGLINKIQELNQEIMEQRHQLELLSDSFVVEKEFNEASEAEKLLEKEREHVKELHERESILKMQISEYQAQVNDDLVLLNQRLAASEKEKENLNRQLQQGMAEISNLTLLKEKELSMKTDENDQLRKRFDSELLKSNAAHQETIHKLETLNAEQNSLLQQMQNAKEENKNLNIIKTRMTLENVKLLEKSENDSFEILRFQNEANVKDEHVKLINTKLQEQVRQFNMLVEKNTALQHEIATKDLETSESKKKIKDMSKEVDELNAYLRELQNDADGKQKSIDSLQAETNQLKNNNDAITCEINQLRQKLALMQSLQSQFDDLTLEKFRLEDIVRKCKEMNEEFTKCNTNLNEDLQNARRTIAINKRVIWDLNEKLKTAPQTSTPFKSPDSRKRSLEPYSVDEGDVSVSVIDIMSKNAPVPPQTADVSPKLASSFTMSSACGRRRKKETTSQKFPEVDVLARDLFELELEYFRYDSRNETLDEFETLFFCVYFAFKKYLQMKPIYRNEYLESIQKPIEIIRKHADERSQIELRFDDRTQHDCNAILKITFFLLHEGDEGVIVPSVHLDAERMKRFKTYSISKNGNFIQTKREMMDTLMTNVLKEISNILDTHQRCREMFSFFERFVSTFHVEEFAKDRSNFKDFVCNLISDKLILVFPQQSFTLREKMQKINISRFASLQTVLTRLTMERCIDFCNTLNKDFIQNFLVRIFKQQKEKIKEILHSMNVETFSVKTFVSQTIRENISTMARNALKTAIMEETWEDAMEGNVEAPPNGEINVDFSDLNADMSFHEIQSVVNGKLPAFVDRKFGMSMLNVLVGKIVFQLTESATENYLRKYSEIVITDLMKPVYQTRFRASMAAQSQTGTSSKSQTGTSSKSLNIVTSLDKQFDMQSKVEKEISGRSLEVAILNFSCDENEQMIVATLKDVEEIFEEEELPPTLMESFVLSPGHVFESEFDWKTMIDTNSSSSCVRNESARMDLLPLISDIRAAVAGILNQSSLKGDRLSLVQRELETFMKCIFRNEMDIVFQKSFINIVSLTFIEPIVCSKIIKALISSTTANQINNTFPYLIDKGVFMPVNDDTRDGVIAVFKIPNDSVIVPMISLGFSFFHRSFAFLVGNRTRASLKIDCSYPTFDLLVEVLGIGSNVVVPNEFTFEIVKDQSTLLDGVKCVLSEPIQSFQIKQKHLLGLLKGSTVVRAPKSNFVFNTVQGGEIAIDDETTQWTKWLNHKCKLPQKNDVLAMRLVAVHQKVPKKAFHGLVSYKELYFLPIPRTSVFHRKRMSHTVVNMPLADFSLADWDVDGDVLKYFEPIAVLLNNIILHEHCKEGRWHVQAHEKLKSFVPDVIEYSLESNIFAIISAEQRFFNEALIKQLAGANVLFRTIGDSMFFVAPLLPETKFPHMSNGIRASETKMEFASRISSLTFVVPANVTFENFSMIGTLSHHTNCRVIDLSTEKIVQHLNRQLSSQPPIVSDEKEPVVFAKREALGLKISRRFLLKETERIVSIGDVVWKRFNRQISQAASKAMMLAKISEFHALDMFVVFTILRLSQTVAFPGDRSNVAKRCFRQFFMKASNKSDALRSRCMALMDEISQTIDALDHAMNWSKLVENLSFVRSHVKMFSFFRHDQDESKVNREEYRQTLLNMRLLFEFLFRNETKMMDDVMTEYSSDPKTKAISFQTTLLRFKSNFLLKDMLTFSNVCRIESRSQIMVNIVSTRHEKLSAFSESLINSFNQTKTIIKLRYVADELDHQYLLIHQDGRQTILIRCILGDTVPASLSGAVLVLGKKIDIENASNARFVGMKENARPFVENSVSKFRINLELGSHGF